MTMKKYNSAITYHAQGPDFIATEFYSDTFSFGEFCDSVVELHKDLQVHDIYFIRTKSSLFGSKLLETIEGGRYEE